MPTKHALRFSLLAAVAMALLAAATPAQAGGGVRVGWSAGIVAPPVVLSFGSGHAYRPLVGPNCYRPHVYRPYAHRSYAYAPYAAPWAQPVFVVPAAPLVRVWVSYPYPHWAMRRGVAPFRRSHRY